MAVVWRVISTPLEVVGFGATCYLLGAVTWPLLGRLVARRRDPVVRSVDEWQAWQREQRRRAS